MDSTTIGAAASTMLQQNVNETEKVTGIKLSTLFDPEKLLNLAIIFGVSLLIIFIVLKIVDHVQKLSSMDDTLKSFIRSAIKAVLWIIAIGAMLSQIGINPSTFSAIVGVVGLALSLSLQSTLSNLFSGMTILTTKPFTAGDYVEIGEAAGHVSRVELFYTTIVTYEQKTIFIPNSEVAAAKIVNHSRLKERRVQILVGVDYGVPTEKVKETMLEAAQGNPLILDSPASVVRLEAFQESSILYALRVWTETENYWDVYYELNERVRALFSERDISITYNHLNVHILDETKE